MLYMTRGFTGLLGIFLDCLGVTGSARGIFLSQVTIVAGFVLG